jgi:hypothetical protein
MDKHTDKEIQVWLVDNGYDNKVIDNDGLKTIYVSDAILAIENELISERDHWKSKFIQQNKDLGCELRDPNGTIWDHAKKLQEENERLREALREKIKCAVTKYIAFSIERHLSNHGITQCTLKLDIDACMREIDEALERKQP